MTAPTKGLLDTSVFIADEIGRPLNRQALPDLIVVSVITLGELRAGVLAAKDTATRAARLGTLETLFKVEQLPVDAAVASAWASMRVQLAQAKQKVNVSDLWIAATAVANRLTVYAQDDDFLPLIRFGGPPFVRV